MGLNDFILNCEKENKIIEKDLKYFKNRSASLQQRIDKAIDILKNISKDVVVNDRYNEIAKSLSILKGEDK